MDAPRRAWNEEDNPVASAAVHLAVVVVMVVAFLVLLSEVVVVLVMPPLLLMNFVLEVVRRAGVLLFFAALGVAPAITVVARVVAIAAGVADPFFKMASSSCDAGRRTEILWVDGRQAECIKTSDDRFPTDSNIPVFNCRESM